MNNLSLVESEYLKLLLEKEMTNLVVRKMNGEGDDPEYDKQLRNDFFVCKSIKEKIFSKN